MQNSIVDSLTGLSNRRVAVTALERMCLQAASAGEKVGLLFLDLDRLQPFNDCNGHEAGDRMLFRCARVLEGCGEANDVIVHWSSDEFVILVPDAKVVELLDLAETMRARIGRATVAYGGKSYGPMTVTVGVACFPDDGADVRQLVEEAELAVFAGKLRGRNCVMPADNQWRDEALRRTWKSPDYDVLRGA